MCTVKKDKIEILLLSALRIQNGMPALSAYELLQDKGACLAHFCEAVLALSRAGSIRSSDAAHPLSADLAPKQILELGLEPEAGPDPRPKPGKEVRILSQGFKVYLDQPLGRGSFGIVYKGEQVRLRRPVAVKILRLSLLPKDVPRDWFLERFRREPWIIARINHPHIVQVIDCGEEKDELWYAMEYLPGGTLLERIRRDGRLAPHEVRSYFLALAEALDAASREGILHRDVKPGNVFVNGLKLADFGLAKIPPIRGEEGIPGVTTPKAAIVGTPPYIAPERANFQSGDQRSDIYSLGATMYHAASGRTLFDLDLSDKAKWYRHHLSVEPEPLADRVPGLPKDLARMIHRCLEKNPNDRFRSFESLVEQLKKRPPTE
ncbi:MAG: serine/threonine protein kinase [Planctomycetes bacterium]|nr:serine/threonine protein kinase [Planctomycetota bacterium]